KSEECIRLFFVIGQCSGQLDQYRTKPFFQEPEYVEESRHTLPGVVQLLCMRDETADLGTKIKAGTCRIFPRFDRATGRQAIVAGIDLGCFELRRIILQPLSLREVRGVKEPAPMGIHPSGCSYVDG